MRNAATMRAEDRLTASATARRVGNLEVHARGDRAEVILYDEIGAFGVTARQFTAAFNALSAREISLRINSPGGEVFDGMTIANTIRAHSARVTVYVDGLAASIASVIAVAGDRVVMADNAYMMVHKPWVMALGSADDLRATAELLDRLGGTIAGEYRKKTGHPAATVEGWMNAETWFSAQEAVTAKLADTIEGEADLDAVAEFDLSVFARTPGAILQAAAAGKKDGSGPTIRELEKALREAGLSRSEARRMVSVGAPEKTTNATRDADEATADVIAAMQSLAANLNPLPQHTT